MRVYLRLSTSGLSVLARSEKAFTSPFRDQHGNLPCKVRVELTIGKFSGLTKEEGRLRFLIAPTRLMNLRSGVPLAEFYDHA